MNAYPSTAVDQARTLLRRARTGLSTDPRAIAELTVTEQRLDEPLRIALAGTVKAGKSTLLNALVGEEIAPTDATECTRVVTWFRGSPGPRVSLSYNGRHVGLPVRRTDGRLVLDLSPVAADDVERLEVGWPSATLDSYTLIDTPGTSSNAHDVSARTLAFLTPDDGWCEADVVIYLMRTLQSADIKLLRRIHADSGLLGIVGVLSRADENDGGLDAARVQVQQLRTTSELDGVCREFVAVSGVLALRGRTLRQREFIALEQLSKLGEDKLAAALVSPGRFAAAPLPIADDDRAKLLASFGMLGIRIAVSLVQDGATDAPALAAALVRHSGLDDLRRVLDTRFGSRHDQLKAHVALRTLRRVLERHRDTQPQLLRQVDEVLADTHIVTEMRTLAQLPGLPMSLPTRAALEQVLGGRGTDPSTRLGVPSDTAQDQIRAIAIGAVGYWRQQLADPLLDRRTAAACRAAARSCEAIATAPNGSTHPRGDVPGSQRRRQQPTSQSPVVDVDPVGRDTERGEGVALRGEVLFVGGDPGVADQQSTHRVCVPITTPSSGISSGGSYGNRRAAAIFETRAGPGCPGGGSAHRTPAARITGAC